MKRSPSSPTRKPAFDHAIAEARALLKRAHVTSAPVPVLAIARNVVGAVVRMEPFPGDVSGMLYKPDASADSPPVIGVNSLESQVRQRFTIAHEIGHLVLHKLEGIHVDKKYLRDGRSKTAEDNLEIEANTFAANLLVPLDWLRDDVATTAIDVESDEEVAALAKRYEVSTQVMAIRLSKILDPHPF